MPKPVPTYAEQVEARWQADYQRALEGHAPGSFSADEYREALEEIGRHHGYLDSIAPTPAEAMNATIRVQAGKGTDADREVLRLRDVAHGEGKGS